MKTTGPCATPETLEHPVREDGNAWPFVMIHGDTATWADSRTELIGSLIDGYDDYPASPEGFEQSFEARYVQAVSLATDVQTSILLDAADAGDFDVDDLVSTPEGEEQLQALLIERTMAFNPAGTAIAGHTDENGAPEWRNEVPLVLIATDYAPYTELVCPTGRVVVVDPSTETTYLDSLQALNRVVLFVNQEV